MADRDRGNDQHSLPPHGSGIVPFWWTLFGASYDALSEGVPMATGKQRPKFELEFKTEAICAAGAHPGAA
jgi:hypothetical protein